MMKRLVKPILSAFILCSLSSALAQAPAAGESKAAPEATLVKRVGAELSTWQEPLRLQSSTGQVDVSVANYRGFFFTYERQKREQNSGFGLGATFGLGSASGGGTSDSVSYKRGSISWMMVGVEPRKIWMFSEQIDFAIGLAGQYRMISWPETDQIKVTPSRQINAVLFFELDFALSEKLVLRQSLGISSIETGPFMRWGMTYKL